MECGEAQDQIIDSLIAELSEETSSALRHHCAACEACAFFLNQQQALDGRLARSLVAAEPGRNGPRMIMRRAATTAQYGWPQALPELTHFISWGIAIAAGTFVLPISASVTALSGASLAIGSYFVLTIARSSFEAATT